MLLVSHRSIFYKPGHLAPYPLKANSQLPPLIFQQRTSGQRSSPHPHRADWHTGKRAYPPCFKVGQSLKNKLFARASLRWDQSWAKLKRLPGLTFLLCSIILHFIPLRTLEQELLAQALLLDINLACRKFLRNIYWAEIKSTAIIKKY